MTLSRPSLPALLMAACLPGLAAAQANYPARPVAMVVPFTSGGPNDDEFRLFQPRIQENMKQSFVFDFRPGAASTIGTGYVAKAAPDGYTLLLTNGSITIHPNFYPDLPYKVPESFETVIQMTERYTVLIASTTTLPNVHNVQDLVAWAKANPGQLNCGTAGAGGISHIACVALSAAAGIPITPIHYKGVSQGIVDVMAGRTQLTAGTIFVATAGIKSGKLRPILALNNVRSKLYPELKTAMEQGLDVEYPTWLGVFAPAGTPRAIVQKLNSEFAVAARQPDVMAKLEAQGTFVVAASPEAFKQKVSGEATRWTRIIREKNIKAEE